MTTTDRALGAFYGLAVGDALGMPTQTLSREQVHQLYGELRGFEPAPDVNPVSRGMAAGRVTDDTEQAVLVAQALVEGGGLVEPMVLVDRLLGWERAAAAAGSLDLLGPSTRRALAALRDGVPPSQSGRHGDTNGAAMRVAPVGIATPVEPLAGLCEAVAEVSRPTHATAVAVSGACAVAAAVSAGVDGADVEGAVVAAVEGARRGAALGHPSPDLDPDVAGRIERAVALVRGLDDASALEAVDRQVGTGVAAAESVPAAFAVAVLAADDPWRAGLLGARLGGDSDTIAAMAGAVVGACSGLARLPDEAVALVRERNRLDLEPLVAALLALRAAGGRRG